MDPQLQKRLIGAAVLIVLAAIFLPMLLDGPEQAVPASADIPLAIPDQPAREYQVQDVPLDVAQAPQQPAPNAVSGAIDPSLTTVAPLSEEPVVTTAPDAAPAKVDALSGEVLVPASPGTTGQTVSAPVSTPATSPAASPASTASTPPAASSGPKFTPPPMPINYPRPPAATAAGGRYFVSLGAFANQNNVAQLRASLSAQGFAVVDDTVSIAGKPATRLRVGPYAMRSDAEAIRQKITAARPDLKPSISEDDAAAAAASAPTASAPIGSGFAVQVGAFKDQAEANKLREQLRGARFAAYVETLRTEQGQLFRVRVGPEAERGNAEKLRDALKARFNLNGNVVRHP